MPMAEAGKFAHLVDMEADEGAGAADETAADDEDKAAGIEGLAADDEEETPATPKDGSSYDFDSCANDIMSAIKNHDLGGLKMALEDLKDLIKK